VISGDDLRCTDFDLLGCSASNANVFHTISNWKAESLYPQAVSTCRRSAYTNCCHCHDIYGLILTAVINALRYNDMQSRQPPRWLFSICSSSAVVALRIKPGAFMAGSTKSAIVARRLGPNIVRQQHVAVNSVCSVFGS
jgi:hypothetical protein